MAKSPTTEPQSTLIDYDDPGVVPAPAPPPAPVITTAEVDLRNQNLELELKIIDLEARLSTANRRYENAASKRRAFELISKVLVDLGYIVPASLR